MIVNDFVQNKSDNIPESFYNVLPLECDEPGCDSPMLMTDILTGLTCSNPFCPSKVAHRMHLLLKDIGVNYVTEQQTHTFVIEHNCKNVFEVFLYDYATEGVFGGTLSDVLSKALTSSLKQNKLFSSAEYLKVAHLPTHTNISTIFFDCCKDINGFYEQLDIEGIDYLKRCLKIKTENVSVELLQLYEVLLLHKEELLQGADYVNLL